MRSQHFRRRIARGGGAAALVCAVALSCSGSPHSARTGATPAAASPATAGRPERGGFTADVQQAADAARDSGKPLPENGSWVGYRDPSGDVWIMWWTPGGMFCQWRAGLHELGCPSGYPAGERPALAWGPSSTLLGKDHWVNFAVADLEQVEELTCGNTSLPLQEIGDAALGRGRRTVYAFTSPWSITGPVHAHVLRPDGSTATDELPSIPNPQEPNPLSHLCPG